MDGLARLEYRGYDSAGVVVVDDGELVTLKAEGKLEARLREKLDGRGFAVGNLWPRAHALGDPWRAVGAQCPSDGGLEAAVWRSSTTASSRTSSSLKQKLAGDGMELQSRRPIPR